VRGGVVRATGRRDAVPAAESRARTVFVRTTAATAVLVTWGYLLWRAAATVPSGSAAWLGVPFLLLELYGGVALLLFVMTTWRVDAAPPRAGTGDRPTVTVLVATYNEHLDVLLPTVAACLDLEGEHETWVLDDGDRLEVAEMVTALGARYVSRPTHEHAKAGNLNHALAMVTTDLVAVFDADHVPERHFLTRTLPYFADSGLALVQTPQHFYNTDSFEHLRPGADLHEESLFYRVIQPGKHRSGAAFWCGTNAVLRVRSLRDIGGVATESLTEDFHTTMKLHRAGWRSAYHNEVLARGLAAGGPDAFYAQRRRWGRGAMQVLRHDNPLTVRGLTLRQRLSYLYSLSAWFDSWRTLGMALVPLVVLATGLFPVDARPLHFALGAGSAFVLQQATIALLGRGFAPWWSSLLFEAVRLPSNLTATLYLLLPGTGRFAVTAKGRVGSERTRARVPRLLLILPTVMTAALVYGGLRATGWLGTGHGLDGSAAVSLFWIALTLVVVLGAVARIRSPRFSAERREAHRFPARMAASVDGAPGQLVNVSLGGAEVRVWGSGAAVGTDVDLAIAVPDREEPVVLRAMVRSRDGLVHRVQFVGRQWQPLAALSATAFGAGSARWGDVVTALPEPVRRPVPAPGLDEPAVRSDWNPVIAAGVLA
jgi:cellulose synthase (UDP-forming)